MSVKSDNFFMDSVKDAAAGGLIALALFAVLIGMKAEVASGLGGQLGIVYRWGAVAVAVAIVFGGRLLLNLFVWKAETPVTQTAGSLMPNLQSLAPLGKYAMPIFLVLAVVLPFLLMSAYGARGSRQYLDLAILVTTYVMLGWGLNIVVGLAGLLDLGYVAFYAVGAYSYALLAEYFGFSFWICLPLAGILAAFWGIILGFPVLRLRGDYLAIVTLAFGEIIRVVLLNWYEFTGGPDGISGIPRPSFFGIEFTRGEGGFADTFGLEFSSIHRIIFLYYLILLMALITNFVTMRLRKLPVGRAWEALREDEIACRSLGINTTNTKLTAFALGAMFGGFAGSFFATRQGFISPESFTFIESAVILAIVVLGGLGSQIGVVIAAIVMIGGFEFFRGLEEYRMLVFGLLMVIIMVWKPRGLISTRNPSITLSGKKGKGISSDLVQEGHG
ncbi:high-affinity branched-chain amino acid ABC transporter permease LivM [Roseibium porphyridii]|uniref:High-affinity branched-chain amino acid ABC transporter permease LivM n=1 Tax=Roseibium porphyridii TaxID=2866279 RepID=A0ABY8FBB1_9HYPH|nr:MULTISPECIES: high-affinity branched-chain amino acid ABC transporter permease LivM [Stappiaceae]QFT28905.1 leucine/isoleucine/valine transporter permease subunit [Labrenzia sp. THAF82]WFE89913.1 high-affinity branched-chain amino acid ABC transporter permease LivM [Roseibium sp. KMA01]